MVLIRQALKSSKTLRMKTYEGSFKNSDATIVGSEHLDDNLMKMVNTTKIPALPYKKKEEFAQAYEEFYTTKVLKEE